MATIDPPPTERFERCYALARDSLARYLRRRAAPDAVEDLFAEVMTVAWRRLGDIPDGGELHGRRVASGTVPGRPGTGSALTLHEGRVYDPRRPDFGSAASGSTRGSFRYQPPCSPPAASPRRPGRQIRRGSGPS